jgi:hypothetical protein
MEFVESARRLLDNQCAKINTMTYGENNSDNRSVLDQWYVEISYNTNTRNDTTVDASTHRIGVLTRNCAES